MTKLLSGVYQRRRRKPLPTVAADLRAAHQPPCLTCAETWRHTNLTCVSTHPVYVLIRCQLLSLTSSGSL